MSRAASLPFLALFVLGFSAPMVWPLLPVIEASLFPVVRDLKITNARRVGDDVVFGVEFQKVRDCPPRLYDAPDGPVARAYASKDGVQLPVLWEPTAPLTEISRPTGANAVDQWQIQNPAPHLVTLTINDDGTELPGINMHIVHVCHRLYDLRTQLLP